MRSLDSRSLLPGVVLGFVLLVVLVWLAVVYSGSLPTAVNRPVNRAILGRLCASLRRECVGIGKPRDPRFLDVCKYGGQLCGYQRLLPPPPSGTPTPVPSPTATPPCAPHGACYRTRCPAGTMCSGFPLYQCFPPDCNYILAPRR